MNFKSKLLSVFFIVLCLSNSNAQIDLVGAGKNLIGGFTFSDEQAAAMSKEAIIKMDAENNVASAKDGYSIRLNKLFGKHSNENGLVLNYKVYLTKDVNAFATADGSVRVFSGLMDIMDDNQLLAVIGHEIGHVVNHDSRDGMRAALKTAAAREGLGAISNKAAELSAGQLGAISESLLNSSHSRKQESEADLFSYDFMKSHNYDVNAVESAFAILAKMGSGAESSILTKFMSSHPNPKDRAEKAKKRATEDGLYKEYVQKPISNKAVATKTTAKKATTKKKK